MIVVGVALKAFIPRVAGILKRDDIAFYQAHIIATDHSDKSIADLTGPGHPLLVGISIQTGAQSTNSFFKSFFLSNLT